MKHPVPIVCLLLSTTSVLAEENRRNFSEEVIVTATRTEQSVAQTLSSVSVFTRDDIELLQVNTVSELLSKAAGVSVSRNGGKGSSTSISLRGNQIDHSLYLVDGVRVGSSTLGSTPIELIDPELIERVEIVRGPKSSLYGSDALGGVINIITRKQAGGQKFSITSAIGNNNTRNNSAIFGHSGPRFSASVTASNIYSGGIDNTTSQLSPNQDDDAFRQTSLAVNSRFAISDAISIGGSYQHADSEAEYDENCTDANSFLAIECSPYSENTIDALALNAHWIASDYWTSSLQLGLSNDESEVLADQIDMLTTYSGGEFNTEKSSVSWQNDVKLGTGTLLTLGYDFLREEIDGTTDYDVTERDNDGVFAQLQLEHGKISTNIGARYDDNEQFGSHTTSNIAIGYQLDNAIKVIASYGDAFKAPTFNDLYFPNFGDPNMVPEESDSIEVAVQQSLTNYRWSIRAYQNNVENLIQYNFDTFLNDQISSATITGAELALSGEWYGWDIASALTILDTEDDKTGNELARRPKQVLSVDVDRRFDRWSIGASFYASSSRYNDPANSSKLSGYGTVALRGAYTVNDEWTLRLKADNLLEKDYVLAQASAFSGLGDYQQPGMEVLFSVTYKPEL